MRVALGVDIGGTFTDIVLLRPDGSLFSKKVLSTPEDYSRAIEEGIQALFSETGVPAGEVAEFAHGTTVATNAIIERKGVKVALVATRGFRDVLEIGRFRSPRLYDIAYRKPDPLVERRMRFEVPERILATGEVEAPLDQPALRAVAEAIRQSGAQAVAVCFINSYVNPRHEDQAAQLLRDRLPGVSVSTSTQLLPQINEYERTSTTVVNGYIRPVVEKYVQSLGKRLERLRIRAPFMIMQSSGGLLPATLVARNPAYIIESGPAAGVVGAQRLGEHAGLADMIVFDMGGTTAKASLIHANRYDLCPETEVGGGAALGHRLIRGSGYVVQVPTIDIAEVGAGGGSIATVDAAGGLRVGPQSAGAEPGPVCYDRGGKQPTVTDANLVLGYLNPQFLCGGELKVDRDKAHAVVTELGARLGIDVTEAAYGIHLIANSNMMRALHGVSTERGRDTSQYSLLAIGGNGGVHAANLAEALRIRRIVVPPVAGLFSALGMLFADVQHHLVAGFYHRLDEISEKEVNEAASALVAEARRLLESEGFDAAHQGIEVQLDLKHVGQTAALPVRLESYPAAAGALVKVRRAFGDAHEESYGYRSDDEPVQVIALKVVGTGLMEGSRIPPSLRRDREASGATATRRAYFGPHHGWMATPVLSRADLQARPVEGPAIIEEYDTTTVVRPGWRALLDARRNIIMDRP
jgi:N-methylhydantoinase A